MTYEFAMMYIGQSMVDEQGRNFWARYYTRKLDEPVPWSDFKVKFYEFMGLRLPKNEVPSHFLYLSHI